VKGTPVKPAVVVDIETVGTPFDGHVVTLSWQEVGEPRAHVARPEDVPADVWAMFADPERPFVSHTKYDARFLRLAGYDVTGPFHDTQVMAWVLNENQSLSLESLAARYCRITMDKRIRVRGGSVYFECDDGALVGLDEAPLDQLYAYNVRDVEATTELYETLWERLDDTEWLDYYLEEEVPFTRVLLDMECRGIPIDLDACAVFRDEMEGEHERMLSELHAAGGLPVGFNDNSNDQLAAYLFSKVFELADSLPMPEGVDLKPVPRAERAAFLNESGLLPKGFTAGKVGRLYVHGLWSLKGRGLKPGVKTDSGKWSVSRPALKGTYSTASDEWVQQLLDYKQVDKLLTTYLRKFPEVAVGGRVYGRFNQTGTKTGRLSSSEPNLQNIPSRGDLGARTRDLFRAAA
jgi:DNA polymerase I-like protein with 3'-5' exonuclease and polymerase domains